MLPALSDGASCPKEVKIMGKKGKKNKEKSKKKKGRGKKKKKAS